MAQTIKLKRSATQGATPATTALELGEVAINTYDGKMFIKKDDGTESIVEIGAGGGVSDIVEDTTPQLGGDLDTNGNDISFGDNDKAIFGAGSDLQIFHDGSNSFITDVGTGDLAIRGNDLVLQNATGQQYIRCTSDGAIDIGHSGFTKLSTTSTGIDVSGQGVFKVDSTDQIKIGDASLTNFWTLRAGTNLLFKDNGTERMRIDSSGRVGIGTTSPAQELHVKGHGENFRLETTASGGNNYLTFYKPSSARQGYIGYGGGDADNNLYINNDESADIVIRPGNVEKVRFKSSGNVGIGTSSPATSLHISSGTSGDAKLTLEADTDNSFEGDHPAIHLKQDGGLINYRIGLGTSDGDTATSNNDFCITAENNAASEMYMVNSSGTQYKFWHAGNDGSGSGLDADTCDGQHLGTTASVQFGVIQQWNPTSSTMRTFISGSGDSAAKMYWQKSTTTNLMTLDMSGNLTPTGYVSCANLYLNAGYGSNQLAYGVRAWGRFEMTGTHSWRDDEGFSSITDRGTGRTQLSFTNTMPNSLYAACVQSGIASSTSAVTSTTTYSHTTTSFYVAVEDLDGGLVDRDHCSVIVVR